MAAPLALAVRVAAVIRALQAGFGASLGAPLLADLKTLGVGMIRADLQHVTDPVIASALVQEILTARLAPLAIIRPEQASWLGDLPPIDLEILNEPDLAGWSSTDYAAMVTDVAAHLAGPHRIWAGGVSNCTRKKLVWLTQVVCRIPQGLGVSVHRYPKNGARPSDPQEGFKTRGEELREILRAVNGRPFGCSEFGYHTGTQQTGWWLWTRRWRWTDAQVACFAREEWQLWQAAGATFATWYQVNDGLGGDPIDTFGIRCVDGTWKPVARTFQS